MSGVETVVGLVLGAIPLAISACEHWRDIAEKYGRIANFEQQYKRVYENLKDEQVIFRLQVENLVTPLVHGELIQEGDLERLVENASDPLWADEDVSGAIKARLGRTYEDYVRVLGATERDCLQLLKSLGFDKPEVQDRVFGSLKPGDQSSLTAIEKLMDNTRRAFINFNVNFEAERIIFGFNKLKHEQIIQSIHDNNEKLVKFLELSGGVAALQSGPQPLLIRHASKHLLQYWRHAECVYTLLIHAWGCKCQHLHRACLWLQHRTSPVFQFQLLVLFSAAPASAHAWQQQDLRIERLKIGTAAHSGGNQTMPAPTPPVQQPVVAPHGAKKDLFQRAKVRFGSLRIASPPTKSIVSPPAIQLTPAPTPAPIPAAAPASDEIKHLCGIMSSCGMQARHVGALKDDALDQHYSVFVQPEAQLPQHHVTLSELLQKTHRPKLTRLQRYTLALAISSSHLQLQSTPWARKQWTTADVYFPTNGQDAILERPYVSAEFGGPGVSQKQLPAKSTDRSFASLGIMLLELCFRELLEECDWWQTLGFTGSQKQQSLFRNVVASKWADDVEEEGGSEMASAIMWCLNESPKTLEGEQWRRDLADRVILLIQNCCQHLKGK